MPTTDLATRPEPNAIETVLIGGDLAKLTPAERLSYYSRLCASLDLNPLTKPFEYIPLNGKLTLYARKDCTEQLRSKRGVSVVIAARDVTEDCYVVTARATLPSGRQDESIGAVSIGGLKGETRANAMMKAETKAKRRVTLSICGLGMLDETEVETLQPEHGAIVVTPVTSPPRVSAAIPAAESPHAAPPAAATGENRGTFLPPGAYLITQVRPKQHGAVKATVDFLGATGPFKEESAIFDAKLAVLAETLCQDGEYVVPIFKTSKASGKDYLVDLHRYVASSSDEQGEDEPDPSF